MKEFPSDIKFKFTWRKYQAKVLQEFDHHMEDDHFHVIAPPGSGKTVLGLEVMLRCNQSTLILAPSLAIRNQWLARFQELFFSNETKQIWISTDINVPKFLTIVSYQSLYSFYNKESKKEVDPEVSDNKKSKRQKLIFSDFDFNVVILDEAHHLQNAWWKALDHLKTELEPKVVSLTGTPPYDVSFTEWSRYMSLSGPIDVEITVPELILESNLCPHQDYIMFSYPSENELLLLQESEARAILIFNKIRQDSHIIQELLTHPIITDSKKHFEWIYSNIETFSSFVIFLHFAGHRVKELVKNIIGIGSHEIPDLDYSWLSIFLEHYLFDDKKTYNHFSSYKLEIKQAIRKGGLLEGTKVKFHRDQESKKLLSTSLSKIHSIQKIVSFEYDQLGSKLRMVILTDYIRKDFLQQASLNDLEINKMGVVPIFELLRRKNYNSKKIAILTGSLVIVPSSILKNLQSLVEQEFGFEIRCKALKHDESYIEIQSVGSTRNSSLVAAVTILFEKGNIEILIGTKALLGEGWDAPSINTLILASFVGSYVSSNQMRGRAIRSSLLDLEKTSNIWHLICVDPLADDLGQDMQTLERRFKAFIGANLDNESVGISSGISRLGIRKVMDNARAIEKENMRMTHFASQRKTMQERWSQGLTKGIEMKEGNIFSPPQKKDLSKESRKYISRTFSYGGATGILAGSVLSVPLLQSIELLAMGQYEAAMFIGGLASLATASASIYSYYKHSTTKKMQSSFMKIAWALVQALIDYKVFSATIKRHQLKSTTSVSGEVSVFLEDVGKRENAIFTNSMKELFEPIGKQRYLLKFKSSLLKNYLGVSYLCVPVIFSKNKKAAQGFSSAWFREVSHCKLIYTRSPEGRKELLKARLTKVNFSERPRIKSVSVWK